VQQGAVGLPVQRSCHVILELQGEMVKCPGKGRAVPVDGQLPLGLQPSTFEARPGLHQLVTGQTHQSVPESELVLTSSLKCSICCSNRCSGSSRSASSARS